MAWIFGVLILTLLIVAARKAQPAADRAHALQLEQQRRQELPVKEHWIAYANELEQQLNTARLTIAELELAEPLNAPDVRRCSRKR